MLKSGIRVQRKFQVCGRDFLMKCLKSCCQPSRIAPPEPVGVYFNYESDANGSDDLLAGIKTDDSSAKESFKGSLKIQGGTYLVFSAKGQMPGSLIECWGNIWSDFSSPICTSKRAYLTDFEQYVAPDQVLVHIGIQTGIQTEE